jgi:tetratricopeptide (TPR) repeat protein
MKRMVFTSILLILTSLISGCIFQTENSLPAVSQAPPISTGSSVNFGGTVIAIAFKADEISTSFPEAKEQFLKGLTYLSQYGRYNESLIYFDKAIDIDQHFYEAWVAKGVAFHNMKLYNESITCYDKALDLNPRNAEIWHLKGVTFNDWGKTDEAAESNRRAAEFDPRYETR